VTQNKRILALDYGERRIGVAVSDPTCCIAQGLSTITYESPKKAIQKICNLSEEYQVEKIVIGMPLTMKGHKAFTAKKVEKFIHSLSQRIQIPLIQWDERLTTVAAHRTITQLGKSPSRHKEKIDQISATILLQSYLDNINR